MRMILTILWRLIFGAGPGNYVGCLCNDDLEDQLDAIERFEREATAA